MWEEILNALMEQSIETEDIALIKRIVPVDISREKITLSVHSREIADLIRNKYRNEFKRAIKNIIGSNPTVEFIIKQRPQTNLNPKYQFDNFVVGPSNQLAYAASFAVAENPAKAYNPLFIYGGVGLGKTHLLHAIGNRMSETHPEKKIMYISSEEFTNELINSIQYKKMDIFREKYRKLDCLLVDDIQFISNKERTAEEFFHTFNALYENQKQIVLSSDKLPHEIPQIEDRLKSRFSWGLTVDIQPPEFETRIAIINKKATMYNLKLSPEIVNLIASNIENNIREIEGALIKIVAYSSIMNKPVTMELVQNILQETVSRKKQMMSAENIQNTTAKHFNITVEKMLSPKRNKEILLPREIAMYLTRKITKHSLPEIKILFNVKSHATIINACKKVEKLIQENLELKRKIEEIEKEITGS